MQNLLVAFAASVILWSCTKEEPAQPHESQKKYEVKFNVADFKVSQSPMSKASEGAKIAATKPLAGNVSFLMGIVFKRSHPDPLSDFFVYDIIDTVVQYCKDPNFGSVSFNLPKGDYSVAFFASDQRLSLSDTSETYTPKMFYPDRANSDIFWNESGFTVDGKSDNHTLTLIRIVGQLEINLTEAIPANAKSLEVEFLEAKAWFITYDLNYLGHIADHGFKKIVFDLKPKDIGKKDTKFYIYVLNAFFEEAGGINDLKLRARFNDSDKVAEKVIDDITVFANTKTILSGTIFGAGAGPTFQLQVNDEFNENPFDPIVF